MGAVCVGRLKLLNKGKQVPFPSGSKSQHKGLWSAGYHSDNLIKTSGYYCSESGSFKNSKGGEEVLVTMPSAVAFDSFSLQQHDGMGYSPKDFTVMGLGTNGKWVSLLKKTGFKFAGTSATATFKNDGGQGGCVPTKCEYTQIKLTFTVNHGSSAVCVGRLKLLNKGKQVPFPSGTKSQHKGLWSAAYHSDNLIKTSGYYCSENGSFKNSKGGEEVLVTMPSAVAFDSFSLQQYDGMGYSPKDFTVMGLGTDGKWVQLLKKTGFKFPKAGAVSTLQVKC